MTPYILPIEPSAKGSIQTELLILNKLLDGVRIITYNIYCVYIYFLYIFIGHIRTLGASFGLQCNQSVCVVIQPYHTILTIFTFL